MARGRFANQPRQSPFVRASRPNILSERVFTPPLIHRQRFPKSWKIHTESQDVVLEEHQTELMAVQLTHCRLALKELAAELSRLTQRL